jgi:hypothetical protein
MIPLYLQLRSKITIYKRDDIKAESQKYKATVEKITSSSLLSE